MSRKNWLTVYRGGLPLQSVPQLWSHLHVQRRKQALLLAQSHQIRVPQ